MTLPVGRTSLQLRPLFIMSPVSTQPTLQGIAIHPIKSCHRIELQECKVGGMGLDGDRRFMVVNGETNLAVTQRVYASMSLIRPLIDAEKDILTLTADKLDSLVLPLHPDTNTLECRTVKLWSDKLQAFDMGEKAATWLKQFFDAYKHHDEANVHADVDSGKNRPTNLRLVTLDMAQGYKRDAHPELPGLSSPFTDWSPVSFGTLSSLDDLNNILVEGDWSKGNRIPINRFRNNLTIAGTEPWEEDEWLIVRVGEVTFYIMQPTGRCPVPGINQDTGEKDSWGFPGPTTYLKKHRTFRESPTEGCFCCDSIPLTSGIIRIGDKVEILERIPAQYVARPVPYKDDVDEAE